MSIVINNPGSSGGGGSVTSVFGRTGAVIANTNDYLNVRRRQTLVTADGASNTLFVLGDTFTIPGGAANSSVVVTTSTNGPCLGIFNSTNTVAGASGTLNYRTGRNISVLIIAGAAGKITDERWWFGVTDQAIATAGGSDNPAGNYAAFRFSTPASDTVWQAITKDGTTQNVQSTGVAPIVNTPQTFGIIFNDSTPNVQFYINGSLVATSTTHLPSASTNLRYVVTSECFVSTTNNGVLFEQLFIASDL
jgi:hypothetical protein